MRGRQFRTYFQFSLIAVCFVLVFAVFHACLNMRNQNRLNPGDVHIIQYDLPADDDTVVVFETNKGTFKAVLYEKQAPKFSKYFKGLVNDGYYDGTYVFSVEEGVYFMGGSKSTDGTNTKGTDKKKIEPEITPDLWPFKGALMSYGDKGGTFLNQKIMSGSRILFVDSVEFTEEFISELDSADGDPELVETFKRKGGVPNFSQQYTVFGQVYDGFEAYDEICSAQVINDDNLQPREDIIIEHVYLSTYGENRCDSFFVNEDTPSEESETADESTESE
ncbi:MAG: peptidylprolyl isomerase [Ruminococcus sp.]|nr:peptidylprolyl isomerase [Ruminococcus sp.]